MPTISVRGWLLSARLRIGMVLDKQRFASVSRVLFAHRHHGRSCALLRTAWVVRLTQRPARRVRGALHRGGFDSGLGDRPAQAASRGRARAFLPGLYTLLSTSTWFLDPLLPLLCHSVGHFGTILETFWDHLSHFHFFSCRINVTKTYVLKTDYRSCMVELLWSDDVA